MNNRVLLILLVIIATRITTYGHPPYQRDVGSIQANHESIFIKEGYVDGIILSDPIRFEAYAKSGELIAQTEYGWNTSIVKSWGNTFRIFKYDSPFHLFSSEQFLFDSLGLHVTPSIWTRLISPFAWLWTRPIGHGIFGLLLALPVVFAIRNRPWRSRRFAALFSWAAFLFLAGFALLSYVASIAYFPYSAWITITISVFISAIAGILTKKSNNAFLSTRKSRGAIPFEPEG